MSKRPCFISFLTLLILSGCSTPPAPRPVRWDEQVRHDQAIGSALTPHLEKNLEFRNDLELSVYLRKMAQALADETPPLKDAPVGVFVVRESGGRWRSFSLPGNRVYLPAGLLRRLEYESELASMLAFELANLLNRHAVKRATRGQSPFPVETSEVGSSPVEPVREPDLLGPAGILSFSQDDLVASAQTAVGVLYRTGYDPRGMTSLWQRMAQDPEHSPFDAPTLERLIESTRQAIALNAPLRNPIVRSEEFLKIKQRIRSL